MQDAYRCIAEVRLKTSIISDDGQKGERSLSFDTTEPRENDPATRAEQGGTSGRTVNYSLTALA